MATATSTTTTPHDTHGHGDHHEHGFAHVISIPILLGTFAVLIALTIFTVWTSTFPLGSWEIPIAMTIASIKAILVGLYFMHMKYDKPINVLAFLSSVVFLALFLGLTLGDAGEYQPEIEAYDSSQAPVPPVAAPAAPTEPTPTH